MTPHARCVYLKLAHYQDLIKSVASTTTSGAAMDLQSAVSSSTDTVLVQMEHSQALSTFTGNAINHNDSPLEERDCYFGKHFKALKDKSSKRCRRDRSTYQPIGDEDMLKEGVKDIDVNSWIWGTHIHIDRAILYHEFANLRYKRVQELIGQAAKQQWKQTLPKNLYLEIEKLWDSASYRMHRSKDLAELTPVDKYRIRKKNRCPTLDWIGGRKYKISSQAKFLFEETYEKTTKPTRDTKMNLSIETGLDYATVSNWFKNRRQRNKHVKCRKHSPKSQVEGQLMIKQEPDYSTNINTNTIVHHVPVQHSQPLAIASTQGSYSDNYPASQSTGYELVAYQDAQCTNSLLSSSFITDYNNNNSIVTLTQGSYNNASFEEPQFQYYHTSTPQPTSSPDPFWSHPPLEYDQNNNTYNQPCDSGNYLLSH